MAMVCSLLAHDRGVAVGVDPRRATEAGADAEGGTGTEVHLSHQHVQLGWVEHVLRPAAGLPPDVVVGADLVPAEHLQQRRRRRTASRGRTDGAAAPTCPRPTERLHAKKNQTSMRKPMHGR